MQETQFLILAKKIILTIEYQIDSQIENGIIEVDILANDVLNIITPLGEYIINKQTPSREIWMASPISGPHHFSYSNEKWQTKTGKDLLMLLSQELSSFSTINLEYKYD